MTNRDNTNVPNVDPGKGTTGEPNIPERQKQYDDEAKGIAEVNVKNAHAAGDGSMGRNVEPADDSDSQGSTKID